MEHIRQFDWCYSEHENYFVRENDLDSCVTERILRNKFRDPLISSESEDEKPTFNWNEILAKQEMNNAQHRVFVPGFRNILPHPKLSNLTKSQHFQCLKVLCAKNPNILPKEFIPPPKNFDYKVFQEVQKAYSEEQKEFVVWAKTLWTTNHCIRALRPKPLVETIYEAEFSIRAKQMESFPKNYTIAAQIPLESRNDKYEMIHEKELISVDINSLPQISDPQPIKKKLTIMIPRAVPEPCTKHPCRIVLPYESSNTTLPLTEVHFALAQYAVEQGASCVADENALICLLRTDRHWTFSLSVCEVVTAEGSRQSVVVLGGELSVQRQCAQTRTHTAYTHLLTHALVPDEEKAKLYYKGKETAANNMNTFTDLCQDSDDSSDDDCPLYIVAEEIKQANNTDTDEVTDEKKSSTNDSISNEENTNSKTKLKEDDDLYKCTCQGTIFERPPPRSFNKWRFKNITNADNFSIIVHCSHKLKDSMGEVVVEPVLEYQLELGASALSPHSTASLALALMLRRRASLLTVRVDGQSGEVVRLDTTSLEELRGDNPAASEAAAAHTLATTLAQLRGLRPGHYLLKHEPSHGMNALLYRPCGAGEVGGVGEEGGASAAEGVSERERLEFSCEQRADADEAQAVRVPPDIVPLLLPLHKLRRTLPCAFTPHELQVAKESKKPAARQKPPPQAITLGAQEEGAGNTKWPKKKKKGKKSKRKV
ncbi:PREDICTED: uncharacterized protein LOC106113516 isoform X2 [Papilio xuthus]|uniref:Uncharacterized protein LOC106113516 isoform X2 n=1 Tax=Papilio xuthus TaxID=66420 RepID=A0AAJ6YYW5_PAPXU|nr:PREDICTED: uncharacterized protein LOC106113516 isoform X2 [Papilio xuthus]